MSDRDWVSLGLQLVIALVLGFTAGWMWRREKLVSLACLLGIIVNGVLGYVVRQ